MTVPVGWRRVPISDLYLGLFDGPHGTPPPADDGHVFLGIVNLTEDGHLDLSNVRHIADEDFPKWTRRVTPQPGDIVFTYEATLNRYAIIPHGFDGCLGRRVALIRPNTERVDTQFLLYSFFGSDWRRTIERHRLAGATVDRIPLTHFPNFPINMPPLDTQRRIADILSAYDDLIDVNQRRIAILEEMARRFFEEWFVHFRYPGHEGVAFVESVLGRIPYGWSVEKLEALCDRVTDGSHWSPATTSEGRFMASVKDMREWGFDLTACRRIGDGDFENLTRNDCMPRVGDILVAKDGANLNKHTFLVTELLDLVVLSSIAIIRPKENVPGEFMVGLLRSEAVSDRIKRSASGAAIPRIVLKDFRGLQIVSPPDDICALWANKVAPAHEFCRKLTAQNSRLRAARDLLLPKLISGDIDLSQAETDLTEAA